MTKVITTNWTGLLALALFTLGVVTACTAPATFPQATVPATIAPTSTLRPTAWPLSSPATPTAPRLQDIPARPQVSLQADLDYAAHRVHVREEIVYPNRTGARLDHLALDALAARRAGVLTLTKVSVEGDWQAWGRLNGAVLRINFGKPLAPGKAAAVAIEYTLDLPPIPPHADGTSGVLGWSVRQTNLGGWFPAVSAYRNGWLAERSPPHVVGETTTPEAVDITLDLGVQNAPDGLQIMASAPAESIGERLRFTLTDARSLAVSLGTSFQVAEARTTSGILVRSAFFREHAAAGQAALQTATAAMEVYKERFGPYRHPQISIVEAEFSDGMEYSGLYFMGGEYYAGYDGTPLNYLTAIAAHEVAHQWWYGEVGNDQAHEPWLDEALCTYSELLYYQAAYPDLVNWWWDWRVARFKPAGWVNASVYDHSAFRPYVNAVYLRGALFLRDLRAAMGDTAFFDFVRRYRAAQSGRVATADDFWSLLEGYNAPNLARLRVTYFSD
jgi:Peptidase family M1 domain